MCRRRALAVGLGRRGSKVSVLSGRGVQGKVSIGGVLDRLQGHRGRLELLWLRGRRNILIGGRIHVLEYFQGTRLTRRSHRADGDNGHKIPKPKRQANLTRCPEVFRRALCESEACGGGGGGGGCALDRITRCPSKRVPFLCGNFGQI